MHQRRDASEFIPAVRDLGGLRRDPIPSSRTSKDKAGDRLQNTESLPQGGPQPRHLQGNHQGYDTAFFLLRKQLLLTPAEIGGEVVTNATQNITQTCADGTPSGQCSATKPQYCEAGVLLPKCKVCDCPADKICNSATNLCWTKTECTASCQTTKEQECQVTCEARIDKLICLANCRANIAATCEAQCAA